MNLIGVKAWVDWVVWLLRGCIEGVVNFSSGLLGWRLRVCPILYPLLSFLHIWAISGDVLFVLFMKETILPSLSWFLVFVPVLPFDCISCLHTTSKVLCLGLPLASAVLACCSLATLY